MREDSDKLLSRPAPEPSGEVGEARELFCVWCFAHVPYTDGDADKQTAALGAMREHSATCPEHPAVKALAAVRAARQPEGDELQAAPMTPHRAEFLNLVALEVEHAQRKHGTGFTNRHEMYAVLLEEVEELWETVKRNESTTRSIEEAVQVAAVVTKWYEGVRADSPTRPAPPVEVTHPADKFIAATQGAEAEWQSVTRAVAPHLDGKMSPEAFSELLLTYGVACVTAALRPTGNGE